MPRATLSPSFESVREKLLAAGIAPRHVQRYLIELREHLADLTARERGAGLDARTAADRARALLGSDAQLVQSMLDRAPRSLTARAPWAVLTLLPVLLLLATLGAVCISMYHLLAPVHASWRGSAPATYTGLITVARIGADYVLGPVVALGCIILALRQRLTTYWLWTGLGLVALLSGMFGFYLHVLPAHGGAAGGTVFSAVPLVLVNDQVSTAATLTVVALRAAVLFAIAGVAFRTLQPRRSPTAD